MPLMGMVRRSSAVLVLLGYGLSFVAVCLGACLSPAAAQHACCAGEQGVTEAAPPRDCCTVVPGVAGMVVGGPPAPVAFVLGAPAVATIPLVHAVATPAVASSPPLILRI